MDTFPQELIDQISSFLPFEDLKNTLLVCRKFQFSAEKASGAFAEFDLKDSNAEEFLTVYSTHRLKYLRSVKFRTHFPPHESPEAFANWDEPSCYETQDELRESDEIFTRQIEFLFDTLKRVED